MTHLSDKGIQWDFAGWIIITLIAIVIIILMIGIFSGKIYEISDFIPFLN